MMATKQKPQDPGQEESLSLFRQSIKDYAINKLAPNARQWEADRAFPKSIYQEMAGLGFLGIRIDEEFGGAGLDFSYSAAFIEELCRCKMMGLAISVLMHAEIATPVLQHYGSNLQKEEFLKPAVAGEKICGLAISEPNAGSDVAGMTATAKPVSDGYIINGAKTFITNGATADFLFVLASSNPNEGYRGLSIFIVPATTEGFSVGARLKKLGNHTSDTALLYFDNCKIPKEYLLGEEGKGFYYVMANFQAERLVGALLATSMSQIMWEEGLAYAKSRKAFGKNIAQFQVWRHEFARIAAEIEACRALSYQAMHSMNSGCDATKEISMAKLLACELAEKTATKMLQVHGGYGYMEEYFISRAYRDVRLMTIGGGTSEIMKEIIAKKTGVDD